MRRSSATHGTLTSLTPRPPLHSQMERGSHATMKSPLHHVGRGFRGGATIPHPITLPISMSLICLSAPELQCGEGAARLVSVGRAGVRLSSAGASSTDFRSFRKLRTLFLRKQRAFLFGQRKHRPFLFVSDGLDLGFRGLRSTFAGTQPGLWRIALDLAVRPARGAGFQRPGGPE